MNAKVVHALMEQYALTRRDLSFVSVLLEKKVKIVKKVLVNLFHLRFQIGLAHKTLL